MGSYRGNAIANSSRIGMVNTWATILLEMRDQMVEKLRAVLAAPVENEYQAVYILVQIRKILDRDNTPENSYQALRMLCNWAVHADLSNKRVKAQLLFLDGVLRPLLAGRQLPGADLTKASEILSLSAARDELLAFLRTLHLNRLVPHVYLPEWWAQFLQLYVREISDIPLVLEDENAVPGTLRKAVVTGCFVADAAEIGPKYEFVFNILWTVDFGDGKEIALPPVRLPVERNQSECFGRRGSRIEMPKRQNG